jgi:glycolate oxidase
MLTADKIKELQEIVGPRWVAAEPCERDAYAIWYNSSSMNKEGKLWTSRPAAVVMPENTKEVSEITRFCNRNDFMLKPFSTGWITACAPGSRKTIMVDLKRMDKIIDIDVKNQIAIIEPYVRAIDLQTELWKHGLNVHTVSCGANHSILASTAAGWGYGATGASMGFQARNMLGLEWVTPSGEILTLGSGGDGAGWFCADGPGPGTRGLIRGFIGTLGSLGTFTKVAVKLYRWDSDATFKVSGKSPKYMLDKELPNVDFHLLIFPDKASICNAGYKLGEAECNYADFRTPAFFAALGMTENNLQLKKLWETKVFQKLAKYLMLVCVHGHSKRDFEWKTKALKEIVREAGGLRMPMQETPLFAIKMLEPVFKLSKNPLKIMTKISFMQKIMDLTAISKEQRRRIYSTQFLFLIRHAINTQATFRTSSGMFTSAGSFETWDMGFEQSEMIAEIKKPAIEKGHILDDDADLGCGGTFDSGHLGYLEGIGEYATNNPDSRLAAKKIVEESTQACIDKSLGLPLGVFGGSLNALFGPHCYDFHEMIIKLKEQLDPNSACDSWTYSGPSPKAFPDEKHDFTFF